MIIPSIDLMNGKAVQLCGGKKKILERKDALSIARTFRRYGEIAVIDLDAALGRGNNDALVRQICQIADCRVGGGIRTQARARKILNWGARKIIVGTKATPEFLRGLPRNQVIAAIDAEHGRIVTEGWRRATDATPEVRVRELEAYVSGFLYTIVEREGRLHGTDLNAFRAIRRQTDLPITAAGGITTIAEIKALDRLNMDCQLGMAIYTGKLKLADAFLALLDFRKCRGLLPTIAQDQSGTVLMLAYSSPESVRQTLTTGIVHYFSRTRRSLWRKGETSGNTQELITAYPDCDRDALLYLVDQQGRGACHKGTGSCFGDEPFTLGRLWQVLNSRLRHPTAQSYTARIGRKRQSINAKIREEAEEVCRAQTRANLIWEAADVLYFLTILLAKQQITFRDIYNELRRRQR